MARRRQGRRRETADRGGAVTRRALMQGAGIAAASGALLRPLETLAEEAEREVVSQGPGPVVFEIRLNGKTQKVTAEPRQTLLEVLRLAPLGLTGAKPVCDRGTCGACTVWLDGVPVYACSVLAVEAEGREVVTIEGLGTPEAPHPVQRAFVAEDAVQCGFCTPGMVMSAAWAVRTHGKALSSEQARSATCGNLCRCGTHPHVVKAALRAAGEG